MQRRAYFMGAMVVVMAIALVVCIGAVIVREAYIGAMWFAWKWFHPGL